MLVRALQSSGSLRAPAPACTGCVPGSECEGVCCKILCKVLVLQVCAVARWEVHGLTRAQIDEHVCVWVCVGVWVCVYSHVYVRICV